ncbi:hypothetical protein [Bifidobacterium tissieri]|uniref:hypothetical protein n=1 Tax=Bifidobacterium tissieri TaxID=1630162 RepID=UPI00123C3F2F|nr:hypothetical protein [Bifidobacterium tissieri]KAA8832612.1 hypothetical protein EM849_03660 [Bifidobacterium tissieri]
MARVRIKLNRQGLRKVLNAQGVQQMVDATGARIAKAAQADYKGPARSKGKRAQEQGYRATEGRKGSYGGGRPVCYVHTYGVLGRVDEARHKTLEKHLKG